MGKSPRVSLMSYVGVSSGVELIEHFIRHYYRLGVDRFLLVLHSPEGDPRLPRVEEILARYGAEPTERTTEFSTPRKYVRFNAMIDAHCDEDDWIVYADTDELHLYRQPLHDLIRECDENGLEFIKGRLVDRVGRDGELRPLTTNTDESIFEQFPIAAPVTHDIRLGWVGKVAAARATRRIGEGGMHTIEYGHEDRQINYDRTLVDTTGHRETVEVAHFRWDASVVARLKDKFKGVGGDREFIDDPTFKGEYERIWDHIKAHGRINVDGASDVGLPDLPYVREIPPLPSVTGAIRIGQADGTVSPNP